MTASEFRRGYLAALRVATPPAGPPPAPTDRESAERAAAAMVGKPVRGINGEVIGRVSRATACVGPDGRITFLCTLSPTPPQLPQARDWPPEPWASPRPAGFFRRLLGRVRP